MEAELNNDNRSEQIFGVGQLVFGKFEVLARLGAGNMGQVYKVRDVNLDKVMALKVLHLHARDERALIRFQNEAKTASRLVHPCVATVYDFGLSEDGSPYMAIEFVEGNTLQSLLAEVGRLPLPQFISIFADVAGALECAHRNGIIHRDVKPGNIMLVPDNDGLFKTIVVDFGLAKKLDATGPGAQLNTTGQIMGTPLYMSPEQCRGEAATFQSDLYSLGCVMYEALAGCPPFSADNVMEMLTFHQKEEPCPLRELLAEPIPEAVINLVEQLLAKHPADRVESADVVFQCLDSQIEIIQRAAEEAARVEKAQNDKTIVADEKTAVVKSAPDKRIALGITLLSVAVACVICFPLIRNLIPQSTAISFSTHGLYDDDVLVKTRNKPGTKINATENGESGDVPGDQSGSSLGTADDGVLPDISKDLNESGEDKVRTTETFSLNSEERSLKGAQDSAQERLLAPSEKERQLAVQRIKSDIAGGVKSFMLLMYGAMDDNCMKVFENCQQMVDFDASGATIGDAGVKCLSNLKKLQRLKLEGTDVQNLTGLVGLDSLEELILKDTDVTDGAMKVVSQLKNLRQLNIEKTKVTVKGLRELTKMPALVLVNVSFPSKSLPLNDIVHFVNNEKNYQFLATINVILPLEIAATKAAGAGDDKLAMSYFKVTKRLLETDPKNERHLYNTVNSLSICANRTRQFALAEAYHKEAIKLAQACNECDIIKDSQLALFSHYRDTKNLQAAENALKKYIEILKERGDEPDKKLAYVNLFCEELETAKKFEKACHWRKVASEIKATDPATHYSALGSYANSLARCKEFEKSIPYFERSVSYLRKYVARTNRVSIRDSLAVILYQYGNAEWNLKNYDFALQLNDEAIKLMEKPGASVYICEGILGAHVFYLTDLKRPSEAALYKPRLTKATERRIAEQKRQSAEAGKTAG